MGGPEKAGEDQAGPLATNLAILLPQLVDIQVTSLWTSLGPWPYLKGGDESPLPRDEAAGSLARGEVLLHAQPSSPPPNKRTAVLLDSSSLSCSQAMMHVGHPHPWIPEFRPGQSEHGTYPSQPMRFRELCQTVRERSSLSSGDRQTGPKPGLLVATRRGGKQTQKEAEPRGGERLHPSNIVGALDPTAPEGNTTSGLFSYLSH